MMNSSRALGALLAVSSLTACASKPSASAADVVTTTGATKPATTAAEAKEAKAAEEAKETEALQAGVQAVVYGLPLVIMDVTKRKMTNVPAPQAFAAPVNQFVHVPKFADAAFKDVVRPNVDTLYSTAWIDLSKEPVVLSVPDTHGRYYLMPILDAWTNVFAAPGARTTGTKAGNFAITGPGWTGTLPAGVQQLKSPTNMAWIIGRTQTNGPNDYAAVHAIQKGYELTPLSAFGKPYTPPAATVDPRVDMSTPPVEEVSRMNAETFFDTLASLMKDNPPPAADAPMLAKLAKLGIMPGKKFDATRLEPAVARGLKDSVGLALMKLLEAAKDIGSPVNGWRVPPMILGDYGTSYGTRAAIALFGLGANPPADAVYPSAFLDDQGKPLDGANRYTLHFDKGQTPPARAFWSITMYDPQSFLVPNSINRYALSSWMRLKHNADGSLDLYIQHESPGKDREANWLPAPASNFNLTMRLYWPDDKDPSILDGSWKPPAVKRLP